jgi:hypothetical protein
MAKYLTKKEVESMFRQEVLPEIRLRYEQDGRKDVIARREAWSNYTDYLCKSGMIGDKQYSEWTYPSFCN